jgi:hypothetical protein
VRRSRKSSVRDSACRRHERTSAGASSSAWMFFGLGVPASIPIGVAINLLVP